MSRIKYTYKENTKVGTHSFYAIPVFNGVLNFDELCEEACMDNTYSVEEMNGCVSRFMKTVKQNVLKGFRCQMGKDFLTIYPNIQLSVKDYEDEETHETVVATAKMLNAGNAKSRVGCTVSSKFSSDFANSVSWQKTDKTGAIIEDDDATENNENVNGEGDNTQGNTNNNTNNGGSDVPPDNG